MKAKIIDPPPLWMGICPTTQRGFYCAFGSLNIGCLIFESDQRWEKVNRNLVKDTSGRQKCLWDSDMFFVNDINFKKYSKKKS